MAKGHTWPRLGIVELGLSEWPIKVLCLPLNKKWGAMLHGTILFEGILISFKSLLELPCILGSLCARCSACFQPMVQVLSLGVHPLSALQGTPLYGDATP